MSTILKMYIREQYRSYGYLIASLLSPFIFILISIFFAGKLPKQTVDVMVKGQFIPITFLLVIFSFSFSFAITYIAERQENKTFILLKTTQIKGSELFYGILAGNIIILNLISILLLLCYSYISPFTLKNALILLFFINLTMVSLFPLSFVIAPLFKTAKNASAILTPIMLLLMFSITMPSLIAMVMGEAPNNYYVYLFWNPMLLLYDIFLSQLGIIEKTWININFYILIYVIIYLVTFIISKKCIKKLQLK